MGTRTRTIHIILSYIIAFFIIFTAALFIRNRDKFAGTLQQDEEKSLPVIYVMAGGSRINRMHGYTQPLQCGYLRETITPVEDSLALNLVVDEQDLAVAGMKYRLYDDSGDKLIQEGSAGDMKEQNGLEQVRLTFSQGLSTNTEYNLCLELTCGSGDSASSVYYYTRLRYGSQLQVSEKLQFVLDFNEAAFNKDRMNEVGTYLSGGDAGTSDYSRVTINSTSDAVTFGQLAPVRTSDLQVDLKEINTEYGTFTLSYKIESVVDGDTADYDVTEYYRIRYVDGSASLVDFERDMSEDPDFSAAAVTEGKMRLGLGDGSGTRLGNYGMDSQSYTFLQDNRRLWLYDSTSRVLTQVYCRDTDCAAQADQEAGIRVVRADPASGDLYFLVYGYMTEGDLAGRQGILIYHFEHESDRLEQMMFIPFDKGFAQLQDSVGAVSYMNGDGMLYLLLEDGIYQIDPEQWRMKTAWEGIDSTDCFGSDSGLVVMPQSSDKGTDLRVIDLNSGSEKTISGDGDTLVPYGFLGENIVYGRVSSKDGTGAQGSARRIVRTLYITDKDGKVLKEYTPQDGFIADADIEGNTVRMSLVKAAADGDYTEYQTAGSDFIIYNPPVDEDTVHMTVATDAVRGSQFYMQLNDTKSYVPVSQQSRKMDPGYDITRTYQAPQEIPSCYYVFAKGRLDADFQTAADAIAYADDNSGTVMTSSRKIIWQKDGSAYYWDLDLEGAALSGSGGVTGTILDTAASYEGWTLKSWTGAKSLLQAMQQAVPAQTIDLTGLSLDDVLQFVYRGRIVVAKTGSSYLMITAYGTDSLKTIDPASGKIQTVSRSQAQETFKNAGSVYYSYIA